MELHDTLIHYSIVPSKEKPERDVVIELVAEYGYQTVLHDVELILASDSSEDIRNVLIFLRDVAITPRDDPEYVKVVETFRDEIPKSQVLPHLYANLTSPQMLIRDWTVYTLGKMGFEGSKEELQKVLPRYIEESPEVLFRILFEIIWLGEDEYSLFKELAALHNPNVMSAIRQYYDISIMYDPIEIQKRDEILKLLTI